MTLTFSWRLGCLFMILGCGAQAQAPGTFAERTVTVVSGITVEADPADAAYVQALVARLQKPEPAPVRDPQFFGIAELRAQRSQVLQELATSLALPRPTRTMEEVFDHFVTSAGAIHDAMIRGRPARFALWRKADLVARLRAGQQIPGFTLDGADVVLDLNATFDAPPGTPAEELAAIIGKAWQQLLWPVQIGIESPAADIEASLLGLEEFRRAATGAEAAAVMTALHETVEATLISHYLHSKDRRWFCEGVANWLSLHVITSRVGTERAKQYYDIDALLASVGPGSFSELERWPAAEDAQAKHYPSELNQANYVRATRVIQQSAARHGASLFPRVFAEIGKTPVDKANIATVYAAYRKITGESLRYD